MNWSLFDRELIKLSMMSVSQPTGDPIDSTKNKPTPGVAGMPAPSQNPQAQVQAQSPKMPGVKTPVIPSPTKQTKSKGTLPAVAQATKMPKFGGVKISPRLLRRVISGLFSGSKWAAQKMSKSKVTPAWRQSKAYRHGMPIAAGALGMYGGHYMLTKGRQHEETWTSAASIWFASRRLPDYRVSATQHGVDFS